MFEDSYVLTFEDNQFENGEVREVSIGQIPLVTQRTTIIVVVVHTGRDEINRLISALKAPKQERKMYEQEKFLP